MFEGQVIVLCKNFCFVGASGDVVTFDWTPIDASPANAEVIVEAKTVETGTVAVGIIGSTDGSVVGSLGSGTTNAIGRTSFAITGLLPFVRLTLTAQGAAARQILTVTLILKRA
jgi:hypothetical protein